MTLHPPAPSDLGELVEAYAHAVRSVIDLGRTTHRGDESLPTDCPGWSVLDQVAHVASAEAMVAGEPQPDVDVSAHSHVRHAFDVPQLL
ncbi:MAG: maleylpyruvate isomerase N-terminal domain-containing protein [Pseudonocardia sp.]|nr:maleylpyruvate isomerase N-terminal domain-containing protein [Pseudonocardia sp.]